MAEVRPVWVKAGWTVEIPDHDPTRVLVCGHRASYGCDCDTIEAEAEAE